MCLLCVVTTTTISSGTGGAQTPPAISCCTTLEDAESGTLWEFCNVLHFLNFGHSTTRISCSLVTKGQHRGTNNEVLDLVSIGQTIPVWFATRWLDYGAQVLFENQDLARDFAEIAKVMDVLLNRRRAPARQSGGGLPNDLRFPSKPGCDRPFRGHHRAFNGLPSWGQYEGAA
jgi:hypothetical protein